MVWLLISKPLGDQGRKGRDSWEHESDRRERGLSEILAQAFHKDFLFPPLGIKTRQQRRLTVATANQSSIRKKKGGAFLG